MSAPSTTASPPRLRSAVETNSFTTSHSFDARLISSMCPRCTGLHEQHTIPIDFSVINQPTQCLPKRYQREFHDCHNHNNYHNVSMLICTPATRLHIQANDTLGWALYMFVYGLQASSNTLEAKEIDAQLVFHQVQALLFCSTSLQLPLYSANIKSRSCDSVSFLPVRSIFRTFSKGFSPVFFQCS